MAVEGYVSNANYRRAAVHPREYPPIREGADTGDRDGGRRTQSDSVATGCPTDTTKI